MRCRILSALVLMGAISIVHADYAVIVIKLNAKPQAPQDRQPQGGGGLATGGLIGMPPTGGATGGGAVGGGATGGGAVGTTGGGRPVDVSADAIDENPALVIAIVEIERPTNAALERFEMPKRLGVFDQRLSVKHHWGKTTLIRVNYEMESHILREGPGRPVVHSIRHQFAEQKKALDKKVLEKSAGTPESLTLALWALRNNRVDDFEKVMDQLVLTDTAHSKVVAYAKVKAELAKPLAKNAIAKPKNSLLAGHRIEQTDTHHYAIMHDFGATNIKARLDRLEKGFKNFYYWWAMQGILLPIPAERQVAVLTTNAADSLRIQQNVSASPRLNDSFVANREGFSVFSNRRSDPAYNMLDMTSKPYFVEKGFDPNEILKNSTAGNPKTLNMRNPYEQDIASIARMRALVLKALEDEWEATAMSNVSARQLMYTSKLLPPNVNAPEWVQFGLGSFFETPLQSPFGGPGSASPYWLPRFKEYNDAKNRKYGATSSDTMLGVVTDTYFREAKFGTEASKRKARAAAWALYYFLAQSQENLDGLQRYFKEIGRMPRDIELDPIVLKAAFARAFDCVKADRTPDEGKLAALAKRWIDFTNNKTMDAEEVNKSIRELYTQMNRAMSTPSKTGGNSGGTPGTGPNPGAPPGTGR